MIDEELIAEGVYTMLAGFGVDSESPNFKETPQRVARMYAELVSGLYTDTDHIKTFPTKYGGIIAFKDIDGIGICPHHLLPIEYHISFAYIPKGHALGLSKIPRIIKELCNRPVLQEDLTHDITQYFVAHLKPMGTAIVINGIHGCMKYRGIKEAEEVKTAELTGPFFDKPQAREEFYKLIE